jgi:subtilisin family serine protease
VRTLPRTTLAAVALVAAAAFAFPAAADVDAVAALRALRMAHEGRGAGTPVHRSPFVHDGGVVPLLVPLPPGDHAAAHGLLEVAPGFGAIQLPPDQVEPFAAAHPGLRFLTAPPRRKWLDYSAVRWTRGRKFTSDTGLDGTGVVVGIVDTGLDVAHLDFRDAAGKTRVAWLMARGAPRGVHPELENNFGCGLAPFCAVYDAADIDAMLATNLNDPDLPRDFDGHGTHVASIAAGNGGFDAQGMQGNYLGMAPGATLVIASPFAGGGFSDPDILNSVRFVFDRADAMGLPAVVNVSLGSDFGPHDGTSALEAGLAAMVGEPGHVIVVAAGNSGAVYTLQGQGPFGIHTEAHVSPNATVRVPMATPGADGNINGGGFVWITFRPGDDVQVGIDGPSGGWIGLTSPGDKSGYEDDQVNAGVFNNIVDGSSSLTSDTNSAIAVWDGEWDGDGEVTVLLSGHGDAQLWAVGSGAAAEGASGLGLTFERAQKGGTVSVPASHPDLIAVGCTLNRVKWPTVESGEIGLPEFGGMEPPIPDSTCYFSGAGPLPDGAMKPDLLAPGAFVAAAMSRDADPRTHGASIFSFPGCPPEVPHCLVVDDRHAITSGTSMSAPHVAGGAALLLQAEPNLTQGQMMEILQAGAARPTGVVPFDFQQGPGELDMIGAWQVLQEVKAHGTADVARSWYALSSPYARPDPSWPVRGVIELRHSNGTVATEVPASRIELLLGGGVLIEPVAKVRAGLYRFAIAAPAGSGGTTMTVDVRYEGQSLGTRSLPVGVDAWAASGGVQPVGGCSVAAVGACSNGWLQAMVVALALAARLQASGSRLQARRKRRQSRRVVL